MSRAPSGGLACQRDPERWFDPASRRYALQRCLQCPRRGWCAAEALKCASYGMWAGIWIDNNLAEVADHLVAIAEMPAGTSTRRPEPAPTLTVVPPAAETAASAAGGTGHTAANRPTDDSRRRAVMAVIIARSCGHCEVMTPRCRYTLDTLGSRIPGQSGWNAPDATAAYAACRPCAQAVAATDPNLTRRLGYLVDPPRRPGYVPIYWRQTRWVYFDGGPTIVAADPTRAELPQAI